MVRMLNPPMRRIGRTNAPPPRAGRPGRRPAQLTCLAIIALLGLLNFSATPDLASAAGKISKKDLKESCLKAPGSHWHESGDGSYGCWIGGFRTECNKHGECEQSCYEEHGCKCSEWPGIKCVRKNSITPNGSGFPGQTTGDQGTDFDDPEEPSSNPEPRPRSPGAKLPADRPVAEAESTPDDSNGQRSS